MEIEEGPDDLVLCGEDVEETVGDETAVDLWVEEATVDFVGVLEGESDPEVDDAVSRLE